MQRIDRVRGSLRGIMAGCLAAGVVSAPLPARAQDLTQLEIPAAEYTLGRFKYQAPKLDGWRQIANLRDSLSLVYAEQKTPEQPEQIQVRFGVALESHDIPAGADVQSAAALADLSRKQMAEARKADLIEAFPIEPVPSIDNLYTYRLLVRTPVAGMPEAYEVYYVALAPDKTQYLVIQCITKTKTYADELYFTQFYGSLASLKYVPPAAQEKAKQAGAAATGSPDASAPAAPPPH